jgi:glycosyltransferase involved in cell wall biosynthesis
MGFFLIRGSMDSPAVVIFFNDWKVYPNGVNAGGGESATLALARAIKRMGYRVIACANLPEGECQVDGIEFWNFGASYSLHLIEKRLRNLGPYHCLCATLVHPFLFNREHSNCLSRIVINHAPSAHGSGLEPATVMEIIDYMVCVSNAQRQIIVKGNLHPEKVVVIRNGFDPEVFTYAGPEGRDWNQLVFIGRIEPAKGIHVLLQAFAILKTEFPELKLSVFGDDGWWPEFVAVKEQYAAKLPGVKFHGKVPQRELAQYLRSAGLLVFPSVSFETAGLAVVDAQASGCPVVAHGVGGVPEYVVDGQLGEVLYEGTADALRQAITNMLRNRSRQIEMCRRCETLGRSRPWQVVAKEVMAQANRAAARRVALPISPLPESLRRITDARKHSAEVLLQDHDYAGSADLFSDRDLAEAMQAAPEEAWPHLVRGIRLEKLGSVEEAITEYNVAADRSQAEDWQPFFRLALLHMDRNELERASENASKVLERSPNFPFKSQLQNLISFTRS